MSIRTLLISTSIKPDFPKQKFGIVSGESVTLSLSGLDSTYNGKTATVAVKPGKPTTNLETVDNVLPAFDDTGDLTQVLSVSGGVAEITLVPEQTGVFEFKAYYTLEIEVNFGDGNIQTLTQIELFVEQKINNGITPGSPFVAFILTTVLTGLNTALTGAITSADTVLTAFGRIANALTNREYKRAYVVTDDGTEADVVLDGDQDEVQLNALALSLYNAGKSATIYLPKNVAIKAPLVRYPFIDLVGRGVTWFEANGLGTRYGTRVRLQDGFVGNHAVEQHIEYCGNMRDILFDGRGIQNASSQNINGWSIGENGKTYKGLNPENIMFNNFTGAGIVDRVGRTFTPGTQQPYAWDDSTFTEVKLRYCDVGISANTSQTRFVGCMIAACRIGLRTYADTAGQVFGMTFSNNTEADIEHYDVGGSARWDFYGVWHENAPQLFKRSLADSNFYNVGQYIWHGSHLNNNAEDALVDAIDASQAPGEFTFDNCRFFDTDGANAKIKGRTGTVIQITNPYGAKPVVSQESSFQVPTVLSAENTTEFITAGGTTVLKAGDTGKVYRVTGANAIFTLPKVIMGLTFTFVCDEATRTITVNSVNSENLGSGGVTSTVSQGVSGDLLQIKGIAGNKWQVMIMRGVWSNISTPNTRVNSLALPVQSSIPYTPTSGVIMYANSTAQLTFLRPDGFTRSLDYSTVTANRTWTLPNATGTLALLSDITSSVLTTALAGLSTTTNAVITASDTVLSAFGKLQAQITDNLTTLNSHTGNTSNPHSVTKAQVGLSNVDNTSDASKPVSTAQQAALDAKLNLDGTNTMTGKLTAAAATVSAASHNMPAGTAPTSPVAGDFWNDTVRKILAGFFNGMVMYFTGKIFTQTANGAVSNTVAATTIIGTVDGTLTLPANFLNNGKIVKIEGSGVITNTGTPNLTITLKIGSTTAATVTFTTASGLSNAPFGYQILVTSRGSGASTNVRSHLIFTIGGATVATYQAFASSTIDTTASHTLDVQATWGTANASNTITGTQAVGITA